MGKLAWHRETTFSHGTYLLGGSKNRISTTGTRHISVRVWAADFFYFPTLPKTSPKHAQRGPPKASSAAQSGSPKEPLQAKEESKCQPNPKKSQPPNPRRNGKPHNKKDGPILTRRRKDPPEPQEGRVQRSPKRKGPTANPWKDPKPTLRRTAERSSNA